jgi:hypothetical protein
MPSNRVNYVYAENPANWFVPFETWPVFIIDSLSQLDIPASS